MLKRALATLVICVFPTACGKQSDAIVSIAVHPTNPNILYVSTNERVYKTRDGGQSWEKFPDFSARRVTTVAVDPLLPATVYAGTMGDAVYKSPDGGQRWLPHNVGLKEHVSYVNQFVFHPDHTETIYAAEPGPLCRRSRRDSEKLRRRPNLAIHEQGSRNPQHPRDRPELS